MKMLVLIFRNSLQEEILSFLQHEKIQAYTMIPKVHSMGETGAVFGSFTSQEENSLVLLTVVDETVRRTIEAFLTLRSRLSQRQQGCSDSHETDGDTLRGDHLTRRIDPATSPLVVAVEDSPIS